MFVVSEEKMDAVLDAMEDCVNNLYDASYLQLKIPFDRSAAQKAMLAYIATLNASDYAVAAIMENSTFITGFGTDDQQQMPSKPQRITTR